MFSGSFLVLSLPAFTVATLELPFSRTISRTLVASVEVIPAGHLDCLKTNDKRPGIRITPYLVNKRPSRFHTYWTGAGLLQDVGDDPQRTTFFYALGRGFESLRMHYKNH